MNRVLSLALVAGALSACATMTATNNEATPAQSAAAFNVFPAAKGLNRAEDGIALADGRIIVADQKHGLSLIAADQSVRPFGNFAKAGFRHDPKTWPAAPNGVALFRIAAPMARRPHPKPRRVLGGLCFANGIVLDEARAQLYLNESCGNRVNAFRVSFKTGKLSHRRTLANVLLPDNIEIDARGTLWVASLVRNEILTIDPDTGKATSAFRAQTADNDRIAAEWQRRSNARQPLLDLFTPKLWAPLPGPVTGIILSPGNGPAYVSGLGDGLVKLDPRP